MEKDGEDGEGVGVGEEVEEKQSSFGPVGSVVWPAESACQKGQQQQQQQRQQQQNKK